MSTTEVSVPPPSVTDSTLSVTVDVPPPPYSSRERRLRTTRYQRRHRLPTSSDPDLSYSTGSVAPHFLAQAHSVPCPEDITEHTPLLSDALPGSTPRSSGRPRSYSQSSTIISSTSSAPSSGAPTESRSGRWSGYFRPMTCRAYHAAVFHLLVFNFPYAFIAWVYLSYALIAWVDFFVLPVTGTTLLIALSMGALFCFLDLLGARAFARGELALQTMFHGPLAYPPPYPPRPIFQRVRSSDSEVESGLTYHEFSFFKNTYAVFTDWTSYQALFYFLVIKPIITLFLTIPLVVAVPVSYVLVLPAPMMLRIVRMLGIWQANVAVEGLYLAVS